MSDPKFDVELAWDLQDWTRKVAPHHLTRDECQSLAEFLTAKGYTKKRESVFVASAAYLESVATTLADEFLPAYEAIKKAKFSRPEDR